MQNVRLTSNSARMLAAVVLSTIAAEAPSIASDGLEHLYVDDSVLCQGFSPEAYYQRIHQHEYQQRAMYAAYQQAIAYEAAVEQKAQEKIQQVRRARIAKVARRREELIAKRKAEVATKNLAKSATTKSTDKTLITDR